MMAKTEKYDPYLKKYLGILRQDDDFRLNPRLVYPRSQRRSQALEMEFL